MTYENIMKFKFQLPSTEVYWNMVMLISLVIIYEPQSLKCLLFGPLQKPLLIPELK